MGVRHTPTHSALPNWREPVAHPLTTRASSNLGFRVINPLAPNLGGNAPRAQATFPKFWTTRLAAVFVGSAPYRGRLELSAIQVARLKKPLAQELEPGARRCKHVALRAPWPDRASFKSRPALSQASFFASSSNMSISMSRNSRQCLWVSLIDWFEHEKCKCETTSTHSRLLKRSLSGHRLPRS